jgi:hypothetical protein
MLCLKILVCKQEYVKMSVLLQIKACVSLNEQQIKRKHANWQPEAELLVTTEVVYSLSPLVNELNFFREILGWHKLKLLSYNVHAHLAYNHRLLRIPKSLYQSVDNSCLAHAGVIQWQLRFWPLEPYSQHFIFF